MWIFSHFYNNETEEKSKRGRKRLTWRTKLSTLSVNNASHYCPAVRPQKLPSKTVKESWHSKFNQFHKFTLCFYKHFNLFSFKVWDRKWHPWNIIINLLVIKLFHPSSPRSILQNSRYYLVWSAFSLSRIVNFVNTTPPPPFIVFTKCVETFSYVYQN